MVRYLLGSLPESIAQLKCLRKLIYSVNQLMNCMIESDNQIKDRIKILFSFSSLTFFCSWHALFSEIVYGSHWSHQTMEWCFLSVMIWCQYLANWDQWKQFSMKLMHIWLSGDAVFCLRLRKKTFVDGLFKMESLFSKWVDLLFLLSSES